jgi:GxxExxY protein
VNKRVVPIKNSKNTFSEKDDPLTYQIIGAAIMVHRVLGPGLLESVYEECLAYELNNRSLPFERQKPIPVIYGEVRLECGFRIDLLVNDEVVVELKTVENVLPIHEAQILTYLRLSGCRKGLLINFNVPMLVDGIKRFII